MANKIQGRFFNIDLNGSWEKYVNPWRPKEHHKFLGTITDLRHKRTGALLRIFPPHQKKGYFLVCDNTMYRLPGHVIASLLRMQNKSLKIMLTVTLDNDSVKLAKELGKGNVSLGIRRMAALVLEKK